MARRFLDGRGPHETSRPWRSSGPALAANVNPMKTGFVAALLLLGTLAPMTTALADPVDDAVAIATCVASIAGPDGQPEHVGPITTGLDVIDQHPACLN